MSTTVKDVNAQVSLLLAANDGSERDVEGIGGLPGSSGGCEGPENWQSDWAESGGLGFIVFVAMGAASAPGFWKSCG